MQLNGLDYSDLLTALKRSGFPMQSIIGDHTEKCWVIRHDIDNHIEKAHVMALVESSKSVRSTYYLLDFDSGIPESDNYFYKQKSKQFYKDIVDMNHDIGWHNNAISAMLCNPFVDLRYCIDKPVEYLRDMDIEVLSTASHGDTMCYEHKYVNYEIWQGFPKKTHIQFEQFNLMAFGFLTEAYLMPRTHYLSDSGGKWNVPDPIAYINDWAENGTGNLQVLVHSQWWW